MQTTRCSKYTKAPTRNGIPEGAFLCLLFGFLAGLLFILDEHEAQTHQQQRAAEPDGPVAKHRHALCAQPGTDGKQQDHAEIVQRLIQRLFIVQVEADHQ